MSNNTAAQDALRFINQQPNPVAALHNAVNLLMEEGHYGTARELLELGEERHEFEVTITRTEPRYVTRTSVALGPAALAWAHTHEKWHNVAGDIDFSQEKACDPVYDIQLNPRI